MAVTSYAVGITSCRRAALAAHFGEAAPICNQMCDLCQAAAASKPQRLPGEQPAATAATTSDAIESASALATGSLPKQGSKVDITSTALLVITAIKVCVGVCGVLVLVMFSPRSARQLCHYNQPYRVQGTV
jgi:hypothetical protein